MAGISLTPVSDFDAAVRLLSGGTNVAIYNDLGLPSIYVRRDKGAISDVIDGGPDTTHYAFKVNGVEVPAFYMGKYLATVYKGRALSLPLQDPAAHTVAESDRGDAVSLYVNFDNAKKWCEANGPGFHLPTIAEYAWIALLSRKNGTMPHGNNYYGVDLDHIHEKGIASYVSLEKTHRTLTGSGPATWNDNWQADGICDLTGNVNEWQGGYRIIDGELQIFADNDGAMQYEQNETSTLWKAILQDGTLVEPGSAGTLKWDYVTDPGEEGVTSFHLNTMLKFQQVNVYPSGYTYFNYLTAASGVLVPDRLKALALMPDGKGSYGKVYITMKNLGEQLTARGYNCLSGREAGIFRVGTSSRTSYNSITGFRTAFIPGI